MPKEIIYSRYHGTSDNPEPWTEVHWSRESGHVQLTVLMADGVNLEPTPQGNGWFATLDRGGINRLITTLRKARDQAFGADA